MRPEETGGGYHQYDPDPDFQPWRPGDPSPTGEAPASHAGELAPEGRHWTPPADPAATTPARGSKADSGATGGQRGGSWWTEDSRRYEQGDRVRARGAVGGEFISHVPDNTKGRVVGTRLTAFGGEYVTVEFENGYTEELKTTEIQRGSWWD